MKYSNLYPGLGLRLGRQSVGQADPVGARVMPSSGLGLGARFSMGAVTKDATSNIYVPSTAAEWTQTLGVAGGGGNPFGMWLFQEAAGDLADTIGTATLTSSSMNYQQAVAGWTRKAVAILDSGGAHATNLVDAALPDLGTTSMTALLYVAVTAVTAQRYVLWLGDTGSFAWGVAGRIDSSPHWGILDANVGTATGTVNHGTTVIPVLLKYDVTNSVCQLYTHQEKMTAASFTLVTAGKKGIGIGIATDPTAYCLYMAAWKSSSAEMSDNSARSLLQVLGWVVAW